MTVRTLDTLPATGRSAGQARRLVEQAVVSSGLDVVVDEALLLVTELVTNAVVHAGTDVELEIVVEEGTLRVEVVDHSPGVLPSASREPTELREGGRGVFLLNALATEWGTRHFATGKSVWFRLGAPLGVLPRRPADVDPAALPHPRRDLSWLVGLPPELEEQIGSARLIAELLERLAGALDLGGACLVAESADDDRLWEEVAATEAAPADADAVRRLAHTSQEATLAGVAGSLVLPLRARSRVFGALVLVGAEQLTGDDVALARLVGDRIGVVLRDDRAQVSQLRSRGSLALLAEASEMFAGTLDVTLALTLASQLVVPRFAAWSAVFTSYERSPELVAVAHADERHLKGIRQALAEGDGARLVADLVSERRDQRPGLVPAEDLPAALGAGSGAVLAVPLVARRRTLGLLLVGRPTGGTYGREDIGLLTDLARRAALAVDNARLYEERTAIAKGLQATLLPPALPETGTHDFGARYAAAGEGNEVGGDFYDVFALPDGGWGLAIGDVCGKGAEAAAITGMARDVLRLLTRDGFPPHAALLRLNEVILQLGDRGRFCTTTLATVHPSPEGLSVRLSNGGHPLPVLVRKDGTADFVTSPGTVLGVLDHVDVRDDAVTLRPGDALVFYTDGVTERRSGADMFGDARLLACLRGASGKSADALAGHLQEAVMSFANGPTRDDLAVLVVRCPVPRARGAAPFSRAASPSR